MPKLWREYTSKEITDNKRKYCVKCVYCTSNIEAVENSNLSSLTCDYIGIIGHSRGCSPMDCARFEKKPKNGRRKKRQSSIKKAKVV